MPGPKSNLPPESQPWARAIDDAIDAQGAEITASEQRNLLNNRGLNAGLGQLGGQINLLSSLISTQTRMATYNVSNAGFTIPTAFGLACTYTVVPPDDVISVAFLASAGVTAQNPTGAAGSIASRLYVAPSTNPDEFYSPYYSQSSNPGQWASSYAVMTIQFSVPSEGSRSFIFNLRTQAYPSAWATSTSQAYMSILALYTRS